MGKTHDSITPQLSDWLSRQRIFFVATAPLSAKGLVNCSPKGMDTFRILGPREVAYLDLTGSGVETIAHLRENGRITIMFCAFEGPPKIVRLYGRGSVLRAGEAAFDELATRFPDHPGKRAVIRVAVERVADSCGYAVPRYRYDGERAQLLDWAERKGPDELERYRREKNARSLDRLTGID